MGDFLDNSGIKFDEILLDDDTVIFEDIKEEPKLKIEELKKPNYDNTTLEKYRVFRLRKMDPISYTETEDDYAFKFPYVWDPYTGERKTLLDEFGPLYFDPDVLIKYYFTKILTKLWVQPSDENGGYYEGYYDDGAGAGEDFYLPSRGYHPEWYLFRLPIPNCYLTKENNSQFITFGPKLTDDEVIEIDRLANSRPDNFKEMFGHNRPSLFEMKKLYDQAISKIPTLPNIPLLKEGGSEEELKILYNKANRMAIDSLVKLSKIK